MDTDDIVGSYEASITLSSSYGDSLDYFNVQVLHDDDDSDVYDENVQVLHNDATNILPYFDEKEYSDNMPI